TRNGPQEEKLFERKLALKNISLCQAKFAFEVERGQHLFADNDVFDVGRVLGNRLDDVVAESLAPLVPGVLGKFVWRVLHETRKNMFARRRYARIGQARNNLSKVGSGEVLAYFASLEGASNVALPGRVGNPA